MKDPTLKNLGDFIDNQLEQFALRFKNADTDPKLRANVVRDINALKKSLKALLRS